MGTWIWILGLLRWGQVYLDEIANEKLYRAIMDSTLIAYITHMFFVEIGARYYVFEN
jgi:hypothetical protein